LKVDSAADAVAAIAPDVHVERRAARFDTDNAAGLLAGADLLVDGSDNATTRFAANDAAAVAGIPLVWGSALRYGAQVGVASERQGIDYRDLFPDHPDEELTCEIAGVLPTVCAVAG
ncbi:ThiF family adenylyltransferase, partial [Rhizobium johnstonii]|uniref:HesA/MoeB/ThiF family protein n=1 Tax=Rhizobium johnstonii TaxID=3019933 RepID=UPI003F98D42D